MSNPWLVKNVKSSSSVNLGADSIFNRRFVNDKPRHTHMSFYYYLALVLVLDDDADVVVVVVEA